MPRTVAALVNEDRLPSTVPVSGTQVIQVVDSQQRVVAGSATADRLTPLLRPEELERALAGEALVVDGVRLGSDEPLRVRAVAAGPAADPLAVIAAVPFGDVLAIRAALRNALLITFPVLLAALAAIAYRVIGWALRPVEELRAGAEQISTLRAGQSASRGRNGCRCPRRPTRSGPWPSPSTACWTGWPSPGSGSGCSWPTPLTSCAARWPACGPRSRWPNGSARAAPCPPSCWPT